MTTTPDLPGPPETTTTVDPTTVDATTVDPTRATRARRARSARRDVSSSR